ncbi:MAG: VWA domain-containing protein [Byssovorax sp.]
MSLLHTWFRTPRIRRGLAAAAVVLSSGGLVLARAPGGPQPTIGGAGETTSVVANGQTSAAFSGPGAHGSFSLSHGKVLASGEQQLFAELDLRADAAEHARERAPLSIAVVLDTSGSMAGEKITQAKEAVRELIRDLRDDDEIAFIRYASDFEVVQPLARAGSVRQSLNARVRDIQAGGGTNIAPALAEGLRALDDAGRGRVRRVVLASDGLDGTRAQSESIARQSAGRGVTVSSMGIGLDFDEGYMGAVAQAGHGNFAFVKDGAALTGFLQRELVETATTTIEATTARIALPAGMRFVRAIGADARVIGASDERREIELSLGSLFAGDERRVVIELGAQIGAGEERSFEGQIAWNVVGGNHAEARFSGLSIQGTRDRLAVDQSRDGAVLARAVSALSSIRQVEAAAAYARGEVDQAQALIDKNMADLSAAATAAPAAAATVLARQQADFEHTKQAFASAPPKSAAGSAAAKRAVERNLDNQVRSAF